ncbi:MAG: hypothetical protein AAGA03_18650, partial [Planctomycetota bacterium]
AEKTHLSDLRRFEMSSSPIPWKHLRNILLLFAPLWCGAALVFGLMGVCYALLKKDVWSARQPLVMRDEVTNSVDRLGRFASQTELKAAQETILEMVQNPEVVAAALRQIGPPGGGSDPNWPSTTIVDSTASDYVNLKAPQGSEFGNTEVVYLQVKADSQQRAAKFCRAMFDNLTQHLRNVRRVRADSIINELSQSRDLARHARDEAAGRMREIEVEFGSDLGELRNLNDTISGDGTNRRELETTVRELQTAELALEKLEALHALLVAGAKNPQQLLISGNDLLSSQPSLQQLKLGLITAQLATSELASLYTSSNPKYQAAIETEREIEARMREEAIEVVEAMKPTIRLARDRVERLTKKQSGLNGRLEHLARIRTTYSKIDSEVSSRTEQLTEAERLLSEARASRSAALSTNLLAELGPPQVSDAPIGVSGSLLVLGSTFSGLIFGLGVVFLVAPGPSDVRYGRRWSDYLHGRRATDSDAKPEAADRRSRRRQDDAATPDVD